MDSIFVSATDFHKRYFTDLCSFRYMYSSLVHVKSEVPVLNKSLDYACFSACLLSCPQIPQLEARISATQNTGQPEDSELEMAELTCPGSQECGKETESANLSAPQLERAATLRSRYFS